MAYIREKRNKWQASIRKKGHPQQSATFTTKTEAEAWATVIESEMIRGVFVDRSEAESTTLYEALERYERGVSKKKDGYEQEKKRINTWKKNPLAKRTLANLRGTDFAKWRDDRLEKVTPSTVQKDLAIISHLFTIAATEWNISITNPISNIKIPTEDNSRDRRLEDNEENLILDELKPVKGRSIWMIPLVQIAIETAARKSELLALQWTDIDYSKFSIRIRGKERTHGKRRMKNKIKYRDVPISPKTFEILKALPIDINGKVFPISSAVAGNAFSEAMKRSNIKDLTFHDLRHEGTTRLAQIYQLHELMKITGHSSTRMLARYYHPRVEELAKRLWA